MARARLALMAVCLGALSLAACQDDLHSPPSRPEPPSAQDAPDGKALAPLDLIYVCGNKFLVTNSLEREVHVTYRVAGTEERGDLLLREGTGDDEGHGETELKTIERGTVEVYLDGERVARRRNQGLPCGPSASFSVMASLTSSESGSWSAPFYWPIVALHMSLLPSGKVLSWGHGGDPNIWDPRTNAFSQIAEPAEFFCSGHSLLSDGNVLVTGGHITNDHGLPDIHLFNSGSESWSRVGTMRLGRWYPTNTTLGNGDVLILAGRDESGLVVEEPEIWSSGSIRPLTGAARILPFYPRAFLAPNGQVFYAGSQQTTRYLDLNGNGAWTTVGNRRYGTRDYGSAVMYDAGKILYAGGGRTTNTAEIIDLNSASPSWEWTGSMAYPRRHLNTTVLPTGDVLVTGGSSGTGFNDLNLAVHAAELWNPSTGTWTTLASNTVRRVYHATSLLLPDGRVLHTGSGDGAGGVDERNAELFSPPYLFRGPRPVINSAPSSVGYGASFQVFTPDAGDIVKVSLIRLGSVTHAFDMNQRFVRLSFDRDAESLSINAPGSRNQAPPGHYMLFLVNGTGVPSVAKIINLGSDPGPAPPVNTPPTAAFDVQCSGLGCTFTDRSADADGSVRSWTWSYGDGNTGDTQNPGYTYAAEGSYEVTLEVTDDDQAVARVTQTVTVAGAPPANTAPAAGFTYSCQGYSCHFTDRSTDDDGTVTGWRWVFGDETEATAQNPDHTYPAEGEYDVVLTATDNGEATGTVTRRVTVGPPQENTPPTAEFTHTCSGLSCTFSDVSSDEEGSITVWSWEFGDGGASAEPNPSHTYDAEGSYQVTLSATDNGALTDSFTETVLIVPAPPNSPPSAEFDPSCDGLSCTFTDRSADGDGRVAGWRWDFGDGNNAATENPSHTYAAAGSYEVELVASDDDDASDRIVKTVVVTAPPPNSAPSAAFTQTCNGLRCDFDDASTDADGSVTAWIWDFGDGGSETTSDPNHQYPAGGTYTVKLQVTDNGGAVSQHSVSVTVEAPPPPNDPPIANFTPSCAGLACTLTDASTDGDGTVTDWQWSFGDGSSATAPNPSHSYAAGGTYAVVLRVTDDDGATDESSASVTVVAPNSPPAAAYTHLCTGLICRFTDRSTDADGTIVAWKWNFSNGASSVKANPAPGFASAGTYGVTLRVTDDRGAINVITGSVVVPGTTATTNRPPATAFTQSCTGLTCRFTDRSTDADGTIASWKWTFGNGATATIRNPSRTYAAPGTYTVTLRTTDNKGASSQTSTAVTVRSTTTSAMVLKVTSRVDATTQYMTLTWTGATGSMVAIYRNGNHFKNEANDGHWINTRARPGLSQYSYRICLTGTTVCSNTATVAVAP